MHQQPTVHQESFALLLPSWAFDMHWLRKRDLHNLAFRCFKGLRNCTVEQFLAHVDGRPESYNLPQDSDGTTPTSKTKLVSNDTTQSLTAYIQL